MPWRGEARDDVFGVTEYAYKAGALSPSKRDTPAVCYLNLKSHEQAVKRR